MNFKLIVEKAMASVFKNQK